MRLSTVIGCLLYIIVLSILDVRCGIADGASTSQPAVIGFINISSQNKGVNAVIDLLSTNLSKNPMIQLVEREQLDIALKELELAATGLEDRKNLLKLGQLIRADGLGLFSLSEDGKILRVRLVDTRYGLRLLDTLVEWKEGEISRIVEEVIPRITSVIPKLLISPEKEVLIGILGMRNVEPNSYLNWLELSLPGLISSRLSSEPMIIVLEREDLNLVVEEKLFTRGPDNGFLGSMVLLEGEVEQIPSEDTHHFTLTLHLKQADGNSTTDFKIEGDTENLPLLTENIANWTVKAVTNSPLQGTWDIKKEAERYLKEGKVLIGHGNSDVARPLLETSYALDPESETIVRPLLTAWQYHGSPSSLERAQFVCRTIDLLAVQFKKGIIKGEEVLGWLRFSWEYLNSEYSIKTEEIKAFNKRTRRYCEDLSERAFLSSLKIKDIMKLDQMWPGLTVPFDWASAVSETPEEAMQRVKKAMSKILLKPEKDGYPILDKQRIYSLYHCLASYDQYHVLSAGHLDKNEVRSLWLDFLSELTNSDDPLVRIMAELGYSSILQGNPPTVEFDHAEKVMKILVEELNYPNEPLTLAGKWMLRWSVVNVIMRPLSYNSRPEIWVEKIERLLKPFIDKGDTENLILWFPSLLFLHTPNLKCDSTTGERILNLLDSVINTLERMDIHFAERIVQETGDQVLELNTEVSSLKQTRVRFLNSHSDIKPKNIVSLGLKVSILCNLDEYLPEIKSENKWKIIMNEANREGKMLWISLTGAGEGWPNNEVWLVGINLEDKSLHSFWRAFFPSAYTTQQPLTKPVLGREETYLGVWGLGIVKFPETSRHGIEHLENLEVITEKNGLPSNEISSIIRVANKLYVSIGSGTRESGFGVYDLKERRWKTISSSRSKDGSCPLNIERPYKITSLTATLDEKKLFFICEQNNGPLAGFWKMDIETGKLEHIWRGYWACFVDIVPQEDKWWIRGVHTLISFNPHSETGEVIVGDRWGTYKYIVPGTTGYKLPSMENVYVPSEMIHFWVNRSALFKDVFWVLTGASSENIPSCIFIKQPIPTLKMFGVDILGEDWISGLYPTPYGVVVIGKNKIGLIEENPKP